MGLLTRLKRLLTGRAAPCGLGAAAEPDRDERREAAARAAAAKAQAEALRQQFPRSLPPR
jgi:hypothetical protein